MLPYLLSIADKKSGQRHHVALSYSTQLLDEPQISDSVIPYAPGITVAKKKKKKIHTQKFFLWNVKTVWNSNFKFHYTLHSCWVNHKSVTQSYLTPPWITVAYCYFSSHYQCILFMSEQEEKGKNWDYACLLLRHSRRWTILSNEVAKRYYYAIILK